MPRPLLPVDAGDPGVVFTALRDALAASGPAIIPLPTGTAHPAHPLPSGVTPAVAVVIETSGSTGSPKRVVLSAGALLASAGASDSALGGPGQWLLALPVHYIAGINVLVRSIAAETDPVSMPTGRFDAAVFAAAARELSGSTRFTSLVPAQLARLVEAADDRDIRAAVARFDRILVGGQATPAPLLERAAELGFRVTRTYGSSETSGGCVYDGMPIGTARAEIVDGQVELSGPMLAEGYLGERERTDAAFVMRDRTRWYRTGDSGEIVDGVLRVTGRLDRVVISGGLKVSLDEVERLVRSLSGVADAVVVAMPYRDWGEVPAVVATVPLDLDALRGPVVDALGRAAAPRRSLVVERMPELANGKPDLVRLTALAAAPPV